MKTKNLQNIRDALRAGKIIPDRKDVEAAERDYPEESPAERYRLAQAIKLIRLSGLRSDTKDGQCAGWRK